LAAIFDARALLRGGDGVGGREVGSPFATLQGGAVDACDISLGERWCERGFSREEAAPQRRCVTGECGFWSFLGWFARFAFGLLWPRPAKQQSYLSLLCGCGSEMVS